MNLKKGEYRMKNIIKLAGIMAIALIVMACTPKKSETQPQTQTESSIGDEGNPIALAKLAFDLIMQLEGRDNHDPAVLAKMSAIQEKIETLPVADQRIYHTEVERLYLGEPDSLEEDAFVLFELKTPRMNSQEILNLQNHLVTLGFSGVGSADGYYGPMTESVIKNIQAFSGFRTDGKVNQKLWDFLFNNSNTEFFQNLSTILGYDSNKLTKSKDIFGDEPGDESAYVYYSPTERRVRIIEHSVGAGFSETFMTYYFLDDTKYGSAVNDAYFFVNRKKTRWDNDSNTNIIDEEDMFLSNNEEGFFNIKNGVFEHTIDEQWIQSITGRRMTITMEFFQNHR
jgi:peptidoglycan hydrolase-like protein with peptidoglycan-binding domain